MENSGLYNYYVHMVHFISENDEEKELKYKPIPGNIELIIVLVHYVKKDKPLYIGEQEMKVR